MEIHKRYPRGLISFLGDLEVTPYNTIVQNVLDKDSDFVSEYFTPHSSIGELSRKLLESIQAREVHTSSKELRKDSLGDLVLKSDLLRVHPNLKPYMQAILLEAVSLEIAINHVPELGEYINEGDIGKVRETIKYTLDVISVDPRFTEINIQLQELYINLGMLQAQVPVIKRDLGEILDG